MYTLFFFILISVAKFSYGFAIVTSVIISLGLSVTIFIGVTLLGVKINRIHFFSFFVPSGTPLALVPLLVPIKLIVSYSARAFSVAVRLFSSISSGHVLIKILVSFLSPMFTGSKLIAVITLIPFTLFIGITTIKVAVLFNKSYVFVVQTASYIKDAINLQ